MCSELLKERIFDAEIFNADCMDFLRSAKTNSFELAIVDPPYFDGPNKSGYYGNGYSNLGVPRSAHYDGTDEWLVPNEEYFRELKRVAKHQIIWGANHFAGKFDSSSPSWIVWDKCNGASSFADVELAYCSMNCAARKFSYVWNGMHQGMYGGDKSKNEKRIHPTQKPVALYEWLLDKYAQPGWRILDTHMGSGSSAVAAINRKFDYVGVELHQPYYEAAKNRLIFSTKQTTIFEEIENSRSYSQMEIVV